MKITLEMPFATALALKAMVEELRDGVVTGDPLAIKVDDVLRSRGIDVSQIKLS